MIRSRTALVTCTLALLPAVALAQDGTLTGVVRDRSGEPLSDIGVLIMPVERSARSGPGGGFRFDSLGAGYYTLRLRRIGYEPVERRVRVREGRETRVEVVMQERRVTLDTVIVSADCPRHRFAGFLCRRNAGRGEFLTEAEILAMNPTYLADIFQGHRSFRIEPRFDGHRAVRTVFAPPGRCVMFLLNGRPADGWDRDVLPEDLIGVEVYANPDDVPAEYSNYMWTEPNFAAMRIASRGEVADRARRTTRGEPVAPNPAPSGRVEAPRGPSIRCMIINYWTTAGLRR